MNDVPPARPCPIALTAASIVAVFQSPSAPNPKPRAISRCTAIPGSCRRPPRSSKFVVNAPNPPSSRKVGQADLDARGVLQRLVTVPAGREFVGDPVARQVVVDHGVHGGVVGAVDRVDEVVDAVGVDRHPEPQLRIDLVALGDRDVTHVVAEAGQPQAVQVGQPDGGACPVVDASHDGGIRDVAGDRLAGDPETGLDVAELPVAVGGLVEVHEVHVDGRPGQLAVELGVQVQ